MFRVALYQPEIPGNTGNIIRLCANTGTELHLVEPLGFELDDRRLRRAGLDYREWAAVRTHRGVAELLGAARSWRLFALSARGAARLDETRFRPGDAFLFGPETRGLPDAVLERIPAGRRLRIPMRPGSRSLNLANAVAVVVYEAWRQAGYRGG